MSEERITVYVLRPKGRPSLQLQWVDPETGIRKTRSARTADADRAEKACSDLEYELNHGLSREPSKMAWETFRAYYENEKVSGMREATRKKAGYVFDSFEQLANPRTLGKITERTISIYATQLRTNGYQPATIQGHLAYLRAAFRWAADQKFIPTAPKVAMPKVPKKRNIRKISAEEFERLYAKAPDGAWRLLVATAWYTGMRRNEMLDLTWDNQDMPRVDFKENRVWIPAAYNKSDADQWLPMHPQLVDLLKQVANQHGFIFRFRNAPREVSRKFTKLAKAACLRITLHDLRRSFGSRYAPHVSAPVLQRLMRHSDIKTTLAYYTVVDDVLEKAILQA
jgi:integrase